MTKLGTQSRFAPRESRQGGQRTPFQAPGRSHSRFWYCGVRLGQLNYRCWRRMGHSWVGRCSTCSTCHHCPTSTSITQQVELFKTSYLGVMRSSFEGFLYWEKFTSGYEGFNEAPTAHDGRPCLIAARVWPDIAPLVSQA